MPIFAPGAPCRRSARYISVLILPRSPGPWPSTDSAPGNGSSGQAGEFALSLSELEECIPGPLRCSPASECETAQRIDRCVPARIAGHSALCVHRAFTFYLDPLKEIARRHDMSESKAKSMLLRIPRQTARSFTRGGILHMKKETLCDAIGMIDDHFLIEAEAFRTKARRPRWVRPDHCRWPPSSVCFCSRCCRPLMNPG